MKLPFEWRAFIQQSIAITLFLYVQWITNIWTTKLVLPRTLDDTVVPMAAFGLVNLAVMLAGDRMARLYDRSDRMTYVIVGIIASTVTHVLALAPAAYIATAARGDTVLLILIPALLGASTGYLLHKSLGFAHEGDDPVKLAGALTDLKETASRAFASTDSAEYYGGPLQVRDSSMAAFIAALIGSTVFIFVIVIAEYQQPFLATIPSRAFGGPAAIVLSGIISITIPMYILVRKTQSFLQARGKFALSSYVKGALVVPGLICLGLFALMGPFAIMVVLPWIFPAVAAMVTYHRLAGYEPLALPDDIEVRDRRTLIAADHPRREMRRIVAGTSFGKLGRSASEDPAEAG